MSEKMYTLFMTTLFCKLKVSKWLEWNIKFMFHVIQQFKCWSLETKLCKKVCILT